MSEVNRCQCRLHFLSSLVPGHNEKLNKDVFSLKGCLSLDDDLGLSGAGELAFSLRS
jgi:hypothetical protein